jgi:hypothetical protein
MVAFVKRRSNVVILLLVLALLCVLYEYLHLDGSIILLNSSGEVDKKPEKDESADADADADTDADEEIPPPSNCNLLPETKVSTNPLWVASFPGSGAELFRELVTSITGQATADGAFQGDCHDAVTCKTHWPTMSGGKFQDPKQSSFKQTKFGKSSILLLRNPRHALPSWYNQIYEVRVGADFHSKQAPQASWERWRGNKPKSYMLGNRMAQWKNLILYWVEHSQYHVDLIVPYEKLVKEATGPAILQKVADVLSNENVATVAKPADIPCLWKYTVQEKKSMKRSSHKYEPAYTMRHQKQMLYMLDDVMDKVSHLPELVLIIKGYRQDVEHNMLIDEVDEEAPW